MNDLTKEELENILDCFSFISLEYLGEDEKQANFLIKIQSMIDTYCEHEYWPADSLVINIPLHCSKCGERFE